MKKMNKKGFTLIEMLVVVAIIAILAAILIPTATAATTKAKQAADVASIRGLVAQYMIDKLDDPDKEWTDYSSQYKKQILDFPDESDGVIELDADKLNPSHYEWNVNGLSIS